MPPRHTSGVFVPWVVAAAECPRPVSSSFRFPTTEEGCYLLRPPSPRLQGQSSYHPHDHAQDTATYRVTLTRAGLIPAQADRVREGASQDRTVLPISGDHALRGALAVRTFRRLMRRTTFSRLAAYFGDLVALTGAAALAADVLSGDPALNQRTIADLSLVGAGLCAHRVAASRPRGAPALALAVLVGGAAAAAAAALAPHVLPPRRTRTWLGATTLLALSGLVDGPAVGAVGAMAVLVLGSLSRRFAADLRRRAGRDVQRRDQTLLIEQQRAADLSARLGRYEGQASDRQSSALRVALSRRLGTIGAIASSLARDLKQAAGTGAGESARQTIARAEELARLATGGTPREQETSLRLVWPQVCDALANRLESTHHLDAEIPEDLPPLMGTALEWEYVLSAVVETALDAMPGGGVVKLRAGRSDRPGLARIVVEYPSPGARADPPDRASPADQPDLATAVALLEVLGGELRFPMCEGRNACVIIESPFVARPLARRPAGPV